MGFNLRAVALVGLLICVVTTLSSLVYQDTALANVVTGRKTGETDTCAMYASLSDCCTNDILCGTGSTEQPYNCDKQYQVWLDQPKDNSCRSMMIPSDQNVQGGPMHCVKNEGDSLAPANCSSSWTGTWVVFDNDNCDWSGQNCQWRVADGWNLTYTPGFAAKSVQYLDNGGYFQFGPSPPKKRDADLLERQTIDSSSDLEVDQQETRAMTQCSMLSSLNPCSWGDTFCHWSVTHWDCSRQHRTTFTNPKEKVCQSLMQLDQADNVHGGPMHCVKNQGDFKNPANCSADWSGIWVVFDNDNCDWSGQNMQWSVQSGSSPPHTPIGVTPFAAKSVTYLNNGGFYQFGPPGSKKRETVSTASESVAVAQDLEAYANINEARLEDICTMYSSLSDCSTGDVTGSRSYQTVWGSLDDGSCRNLSNPDQHGRAGGAISCVQNVQGCPVNWTGYWVVYDNDHCDDQGQAFTVPVVEAADAGFQLPSGGLSVRYEMFLPPHMGSVSTARDATETRQTGPCTLITSLLECSNPNVWCSGENGESEYEWEFAADDRSCRNLTGNDKSGKEGGPMYCVKNQEAANGFGRCDAGWDGFWIFYDNLDCNESGKTFSIPVFIDTSGPDFEVVSGAMSVRYASLLDGPGEGLPASVMTRV